MFLYLETNDRVSSYPSVRYLPYTWTPSQDPTALLCLKCLFNVILILEKHEQDLFENIECETIRHCSYVFYSYKMFYFYFDTEQAGKYLNAGLANAFSVLNFTTKLYCQLFLLWLFNLNIEGDWFHFFPKGSPLTDHWDLLSHRPRSPPRSLILMSRDIILLLQYVLLFLTIRYSVI